MKSYKPILIYEWVIPFFVILNPSDRYKVIQLKLLQFFT